MTFNLLASRQKKKPSPYVADPSQLKTTTVQRQPSYKYDYASLPGGATQIRRQTTAQANRPELPGFTPGSTPPINGPARMYNIARIGPGVDLKAPQFPWQMRRGITSDASRQGAFRAGFGSGKGRVGFARKSVDTFFDSRYMFNPNYTNWALRNTLRRQYGV